MSALLSELHRLAAQPPSQALGPLERLLARSERLPAEQLFAEQLEYARELIVFAAEAVPFYRKLQPVRTLPSGALSAERFRELPIVTRAVLQEHADDLTAKGYRPEDAPLGGTSTSGSTGRPIKVHSSAALSTLALAQELRFHRWNQRRFTATAAVISTPHPAGVADPPLGRSGRRWSVRAPSPAVELTLRATVREQLEWLSRQNADYLVSYPSNVMALARLSLELGSKLRLQEVTVSSEPVSSELRKLVHDAWGARVVATYSANEAGGIALQGFGTPHYFVQSEFVLVEVLRDDGEPCAPGEVGRVVVTTLHNRYQPLIRYETGDYAEVGPHPHGPVLLPRLARVMGRERNMVRLPGGDQVWPFFELGELVRVKALVQWQILQRSERELEVRLATAGAQPLPAETEAVVRKVVTACLPAEFDVTLRYVSEIPRGPRGKYEEFVNLMLGNFQDSLG